MPVSLRPRNQLLAFDLCAPICTSLFVNAGRLAGAGSCNGRQFTASDCIQHSVPPRYGFLGCGAPWFDIAPQASRIRYPESADELPGCIVWLAGRAGRACFSGRTCFSGNSLNDQHSRAQTCTADRRAISNHNGQRIRHALLDSPCGAENGQGHTRRNGSEP